MAISIQTRNKFIALIKKGKSLNEITKITGVGKTTVYYHMRKIRGRRNKPITIKKDNLELLGEVLGFFAGDGSLVNRPDKWDYRVKFFLNIKEVLVVKNYNDSISRFIGKPATLFNRGSMTIIQITSKDFCEFIKDYLKFGKSKTKTIELKNKDLLKNIRFTIGFMKGLIDSDGYVRKDRKEIYFGSISRKLANDFISGLNLLSIRFKEYIQKRQNCNDFYKIRISGVEVDRFNKIIKPIKAS